MLDILNKNNIIVQNIKGKICRLDFTFLFY